MKYKSEYQLRRDAITVLLSTDNVITEIDNYCEAKVVKTKKWYQGIVLFLMVIFIGWHCIYVSRLKEEMKAAPVKDLKGNTEFQRAIKLNTDSVIAFYKVHPDSLKTAKINYLWDDKTPIDTNKINK